MYQKSRSEWSKHIVFVVLDIICLQISYISAFFLRFGNLNLFNTGDGYLTAALVMTLGQIIGSLLLNSYKDIHKRSWVAELLNNGITALIFVSVTALYFYSVHTAELYSRLLVFFTSILYVILCTTGRIILKRIMLHRKSGSIGAKSLLLVTDSAAAKDVISDIKGDIASSYVIKGVVLTDSFVGEELSGIPIVAELSGAADYICREWVDEILVCTSESSSQTDSLIRECAEMGVTVHSVINLNKVDRNKQFIEEIGNRAVLTTAFNYVAPYQAFIKRAFDIVGGLVGAIFAVLIGIVIGPFIYLNSPGPILFKQNRIGRNGKVFKVLKFRSMYLDADERKKEFMDQNRVADGMMFKLDFDPRIIGNKVLPDGTKKTGIGEFIRKTSLDEFPQFFNVLKGDMSLVGTRPPTVDEWEKYQYHHRARLAIKPGITGMWQVSGRSEIRDFEEVVKLDTEYICKFRLSLDFKILLKTIIVLFQRKGAM